MPFKKGDRGNPHGRPKGSENKATSRFKENLNKLLEDNSENMVRWLEEIAADSPKDAFAVLKDFSEYIHPKLARTELTGEDNSPLNIIVKKYND